MTDHEKEMQWQSKEFKKDPIKFIENWSFDPNKAPGFHPDMRVIPTHIMVRVMEAYMDNPIKRFFRKIVAIFKG